MMNHIFEIPKQFWITVTAYQCEECSELFKWRWAEGGEVVKFVSLDGSDERWLPTYGGGGYLELLASLVSGFTQDSEISIDVSLEFKRVFIESQQLMGNDRIYIVDERKISCPVCSSTNRKFVSQTVESSPPVAWLDIDDLVKPVGKL